MGGPVGEIAYTVDSGGDMELRVTGGTEPVNSSISAVTSQMSPVTFTAPSPVDVPPLSILLGAALFVVVVVSAAANIFVLLSYAYEKKLRTTFSILIANLALTDFIVAIIPMNFYTVNITFGYWPLGKILCGLWVVVDYNTVFASTYSLAAISIDRLWSIKWSIHYRQHNTKRKAAVIVAMVWLTVFAVAMYPTISDRILRTRERQCEFVPSENPRFVVALALLGHHIPSAIIVICYIIVYIEIRKLVRTRPHDKIKASTAASAQHGAAASRPHAVNAAAAAAAGDGEEISIVAKTNGGARLESTDDDESFVGAAAPAPDTVTSAGGGHRIAASHKSAAATGESKSRADRERKTFVTLSYIVIAYVVCWVPFHFTYDVSFIRPDIVPQQLFVALFWMTYVNSTLNPFLYAFSSADVRSAAKKMIKCQFRQ